MCEILLIYLRFHLCMKISLSLSRSLDLAFLTFAHALMRFVYPMLSLVNLLVLIFNETFASQTQSIVKQKQIEFNSIL